MSANVGNVDNVDNVGNVVEAEPRVSKNGFKISIRSEALKSRGRASQRHNGRSLLSVEGLEVIVPNRGQGLQLGHFGLGFVQGHSD